MLAINLGIWAALNRPVAERPWIGSINCVSFAPFQRDQNPLENKYPTYEQIFDDISRLSRQVDGVRTYTSMHGEDKVPEIAQQYGMHVIAGAWVENINHSKAEDVLADNPVDKAEVDAAVATARRNANVSNLVIGNEAVLRGDYTPHQMAELLKKVYARKPPCRFPPPMCGACGIRIPSWWSPPIIWPSMPCPIGKACRWIRRLQYVMDKYDRLHEKYPDKPIMLAEVGWPSAGPYIKGAEPSKVNQARFIRDFLNAAREKPHQLHDHGGHRPAMEIRA